jgi:HSP20 family protein
MAYGLIHTWKKSYEKNYIILPGMEEKRGRQSLPDLVRSFNFFKTLKTKEVIMTNVMQKNKVNGGYRLDAVVDNIFNHSLRRFFDGNLWDSENALTAGTVPVNVRETEQQYEVDVIAPGCKKEDFRIQVLANELSISFNCNDEKKEENERSGWVRNEFVQRSFTRSFALDDTVSTDKINARYEDGILKLVLPKNEKAKPRLLAIDVK